MTSSHHVRAQLAYTFGSAIRSALVSQRRYVEQLGEQVVKDGFCTGFVDLDMAGESVIEIDFPLRFIERPLFTTGLELGDNQHLSFGTFPTWSATVAAWNTQLYGETALYTGATIGAVINNVERSKLHYSFQGLIITAPYGPSDSVGAVL